MTASAMQQLHSLKALKRVQHTLLQQFLTRYLCKNKWVTKLFHLVGHATPLLTLYKLQ